MRTVTPIPRLTLDEGLYAAAHTGLHDHVPDLVVPTWEWFTTPDNWALIPDPAGVPYKAELTVLNTRARTVKINLWYAPDLRAGDTPRPHSHPWDFTATILAGGYDETRYAPGRPGVETRSHVAGGANEVGRDVFHEVVAIHDPGRTVTLMDCGPGVRGSWGHLDPATGLVEPAAPDSWFSARFAALNPHLTG